MGRAYQQHIDRLRNQPIHWRLRPGGIDPSLLRERGGLEGYSAGKTGGNLWEAAAQGMGLGNVGNDEEYDRLVAAAKGAGHKDFDSYDDVQGMIAWDRENYGREEENPAGGGAAGEGNPPPFTDASNPERPTRGAGEELDTGEDMWSNMMMMMMMMNMMKPQEMPEPQKATHLTSQGASSQSSAQGARAKKTAAVKSGTATKGTNVWGRDSMKIGTLNMA